jgi:hypothetical protein
MNSEMKRARASRRGSAYLIVLGAALLVALLGLSSLMALRIQRQMVEDAVDAAEARAYAQSAIEVGLSRIAADGDWRTTFSDGVWIADQPLGEGTFTLEGHDPADGDLADDDTDDLLLVGIGLKGRARQKMLVRLVPELRGVAALEAALFSGGQLTISNATINSDGLLASNAQVSSGSSAINADVESAGAINGSGYNGSTTTAVDARTTSDDTSFSPYAAAGTSIPISSIPVVSSVRTIENVVLSAGTNPYGTANGQGLYVIDCQAQSLTIRNARIAGTLVLLNAGTSSKIEQSVNWETAVANYPALMVQGPFLIDMSATALSEAALGVNYNPAGAEYQGASDSDTVDSYPSQIRGLVFISGNASFSTDNTIDGAVLALGSTDVTGQLTLMYDDIYLTNPPPGFLDRTRLTISPGSWSKDVD